MKTPRLLLAATFAALLPVIAAAVDAPATPAKPAAPAAVASAVDATGNWKWSFSRPNSDQKFESTAKFVAKDGVLTGTVTGRLDAVAIGDGTVKDGMVAFTITRERDGNKFVLKYSGQLTADTIKGTLEFPAFNGSEPMKADWIASRVK